MIVTATATVSPPSEATAHPERGVCVTMTSSGPMLTVVPSTTISAAPWSRSRVASRAGSAPAIAAATGCVPFPNLLPRARKFGRTV